MPDALAERPAGFAERLISAAGEESATVRST